MEVVGTGRVQQRPDMVVAGDLVQAEQRLAIRAPLSLLQTALVRQERRALQEEQGKRRQADVRHRVARIASLPEVRQRVAAPAQRRDETIQDFHAPEKSDFRRRGNPPKALQSAFSTNRWRDPQALVATQCQSDLELLNCWRATMRILKTAL